MARLFVNAEDTPQQSQKGGSRHGSVQQSRKGGSRYIGRRFAPPHSVPLQRAARSPWTPHLHTPRQSSAFLLRQRAGGGCGTKASGSGGAGRGAEKGRAGAGGSACFILRSGSSRCRGAGGGR
jgi:hypothetical protein